MPFKLVRLCINTGSVSKSRIVHSFIVSLHVAPGNSNHEALESRVESLKNNYTTGTNLFQEAENYVRLLHAYVT